MDDTFSFVIDLDAAQRVFLDVGAEAITLAVLAGIPVETRWQGCLVYEGESPVEEGRTACIATRGPGADSLQERLVAAFEGFGIPVLSVYEGGPEVRRSLARAEGERWTSAG